MRDRARILPSTATNQLHVSPANAPPREVRPHLKGVFSRPWTGVPRIDPATPPPETAILKAHQHDRILQAMSEYDIRALQEQKLAEYLARKRKRVVTALLALVLLGLAVASSAQTESGTCVPTTATTVNPKVLSVIQSPDALYVAAYRVAVFAKGVTPADNTAITKMDVPKSQFLEVPNEPGCIATPLNAAVLLGTPIPALMESVFAVKAILQPGAPFDTLESAWSGASAPFLKSGTSPRPTGSVPRLTK